MRRAILLGLLILILLLLIGVVVAAAQIQYSINWQVLSAGGAPATSASGHVSMNGTVGQTAIGPSSSNQTTLWAGFWHSLKQALINSFMPIVLR